MKHAWTIEPSDIKKVKAFLDLHRDDLFVRQPIEWNLGDDKPPVKKEDFWQQMVACLRLLHAGLLRGLHGQVGRAERQD